ncbi:sorting nexin-22-like isoform X2 [Centruroides vittatus]|uniref:sorting nexin-22-like isoform X2 n=1 Tax=Centruroides vittatus TaxID=120091 RepID=UPI00350F11E9
MKADFKSFFYHVFCIEVFVTGKCHKIERRYRAFHSMHKQLKKIIQTPEFPPKRVRNWNSKVLEQRRKGLENYIQELLKMKPIPKELLSFLSLSAVDSGRSSNPIGNTESGHSHQPILTFVSNPYPETNETPDSLPNVVVKGTIMGLYSHVTENYENLL